MRRWMAAPLGLAAAVALALTAEPTALRAQDKKYTTTEETILTADGMKLRGLFHKSKDGDATSPVVLLLYPPGPGRDMTTPAGKWDGLISRLAEKKFHVMQFDWRGHGRSTDITDPPVFFTNSFSGPQNYRLIKGAAKKPLKNTLSVKEIDPRYFPVYVNDLAAVRVHLDQKNDQGDLNASSIYVVAAEEAATLGLFWLTTEWSRPAVHPTLPNGLTVDRIPYPALFMVNPQAGRDVAGCIWLSANRPPTVVPGIIQRWVQVTQGLRDNNPMLFLYGETDTPAATAAKGFFNDVLVANGNPGLGIKKLDQTFLRPVPGTKLRGVELLGDNKLGTEDTIMKYLDAIQKERASITVKKRNYTSPFSIILAQFGLNP